MTDRFGQFCGEQFWDINLSWNTSSPKLTECFNKTVMVWIPPAFLLVFSPLIIVSLLENKIRIEWNFYNKIRQLLSLLGIILSLSEFITVVVKYFQSDDTKPSNPDITGSVIRFIFSIYIFLLFVAQVYRGLHTSGVIWFYFLISIISGAPNLHASIHWYSTQFYEWLFMIAQYFVTILLFLIYCFADTLPQNEKKNIERPDCPKESASFLSRLSFSWFTSMAILGWKKPLTISDLWQVRDADKSSCIFANFNKNWLQLHENKDQTNIRSNSFSQTNGKTTDGNSNKVKENIEKLKKSKPPGIIRTMLRTFWFYFFTGAFFKLLSDLLTFVNPQIMKLLMGFISDPEEHEWHGYVYAVILFLTTMLQILCQNYYFNRMLVIGMRIRTCLMASVYRKSLRLSNSARNEATTGEIVNLMAVDSQRFLDMTAFINMLWSAPLQIALSLIFLYLELGPSVFGGLAIMIIMIPINGYLTSISKKLQIKQMKLKDERVKAMNEILNGIKVLKLYGWEKAFMTNILKVRDRELNNLKTINYFGCALQCLWFCAPFLVSFVTFAIYVLIDESNVLTPEKAFVSLALFNILRFPLSMLPNLVTSIITTTVSVKRLDKFLNSSELSGYVNRKFDEKHAIRAENAFFSWKKESENGEKGPKTILNNINLKIAKKSFVAIVGRVGSGKSSLLSALLGDMEIESGNIQICSSMKIAYVPQQAWIQNETLRNNIIFGNTDNQKRYDQIIQSCALKPDLSILPGGDATEIGEKGINLSGGQKQRVSLARACFSDSDLYLLDDPLSAVDSHVGKHIFEEVLDSKTGILRDKTRILVTNSLSILPFTDQIIVLKDGEINEMGTYKELLAKKQTFFELIEQYSNNNESEGESNYSNTEEKVKPDNEIELDKTKLVEIEKVETGQVKLSVYLRYFKSVSIFWFTVIIINYALMQVSAAGSSLWLAEWSDESAKGDDRTLFYLLIYGVIGFSQAIFVAYGWYAMTKGILKAAKLLHFQMLDRIMHSPMSFFDTTPLGRILNRFSKDVDTCDSVLQFTIRVWIVCCFQSITTIVIISMEVPMFLVVVVPIAVLFYFVQKFYVITSRQLKRLESITKSPIYSHFSETLSGVATLRAYGVDKQFIIESDDRLDLNNCCFVPNVAANRWLSIRLEMVANLIVLFAAVFSVIYRKTMDASQVGLIVSYALNTTQNLNWLVRTTSDIETNIVGVERILEYTDLPTEAEWHISATAPETGWPLNGKIEFKDYSTKYRTGLELVLKQISFDISKGEKIGIVGRTGAGKSSLTLALFRLIEATDGNIVIDGINISEIGLHQLRSRITIIPQDPILFSGTIRSNLDPFTTYSDDELWRSLELSHLKSFVKSLDLGLEHRVAEGGENLSVGQRQLICLARALLRNTKVLILDEATAAVDLETDSLIQSTIRKAFSDSTVLTIAHRLNTIMDSNRVLVLSDGKVSEFDSPNNLLANNQSLFHSLAKDAGIIR